MLRFRSVAVVVATVVGFSTLALPALGHGQANYWEAEWRSQDRGTSNQRYEFTDQVPGDANSSFANRVADGAVKWNQIAINGADMGFARNGVVSDYNPFAACSSIPFYKNGIHYRDIPDDPAGNAGICFSGVGTPSINSFQVTFDDDKNWYNGNDYTMIGGSQLDVQGVSAHEFGHVVGGWTDGTPEGHFDSTTNPELCGSGVPDTGKHTMCARSGVGLEASLKRTLETHDIDTFQTAYA